MRGGMQWWSMIVHSFGTELGKGGRCWAWIAEGQVPEKVGNTPHPHSVVEEDLGLFSVSLVSLASLNQRPQGFISPR